MIKKRYLLIFSLLAVFVFSVSVYQYMETMRADIVSAANTKPNLGHSWSEMESDSDSVQVTGQTITNLVAPVANSDAVNKAYVDQQIVSASGSKYQECYVLYDRLSNTSTCTTGYTTVVKFNRSTVCWEWAESVPNSVKKTFGVGGGTMSLRTYFYADSYPYWIDCLSDTGFTTAHTCPAHCNGSLVMTDSSGTAQTFTAASVSGDATAPVYNTFSLAVCCK